ncbi:MAG TPA: sigma 54-interacting transcriptional regulator [Candidatus Anaerotruncus excrementipullorum]|uniref:Sigma 54-interacting transcriptional regulator n=1 Tax=Candidatus Anaerotruncus excrementipullorum TaxID=2838465 RepID=A0A9D2B8S5_9FIRM|nr:sigma 54-interacting transcriptional regulator [Candidatus Anaerotruncus excrementipullorum]
MVRERLMECVQAYTRCFDPSHPTPQLTAEALAEENRVRRNTASHYLNLGVSEGTLLKINTRPVYFLHRAVFEERFFPVENTVFSSWAELFQPDRAAAPAGLAGGRPDVFQELIGYSGSLRQPLTQIKASVLYPDNSLPIMLQGPTGVGKSLIASLTFRFAVASGVLQEDAPFLSFNCAQYANNPELLSSTLFGHTKGSFTGAYATTKGLLEAADGGMLFLDEVHRLSWEGQEKLFTFMDQGVFRRIGESSGWHRSNVRLMMATTEPLNSNFLGTFLRRIPVCVYIPSLEERGLKEKQQLLLLCFSQECQTIRRRLRISGLVQSLLLSHTYSGNLGELKNVTKYAAATAFARNYTNPVIDVGLQDLPESIISQKELEGISAALPELVLDPEEPFQLPSLDPSPVPTARPLLSRLAAKFDPGSQNGAFESAVRRECREFCNYLLYDYRPDQEAILQFVSREVESAWGNLERNSGFRFTKADIRAISLYFYRRKVGEEGEASAAWGALETFFSSISQRYELEAAYAQTVLQQLATALELPSKKEDLLLLILFFLAFASHPGVARIRALILAQGFATASSIADVANQQLNDNLFDALDIPLEASPEQMQERVKQYLARTDLSHGLILINDVTLPDSVLQSIRSCFSGPLMLLHNASTQLVLQVGRYLQNASDSLTMEDLAEAVIQKSLPDFQILYPKADRQRAILTCCTAGMGAAQQLKRILDNSLPTELGVKVIPTDYHHLKRRGKNDPLFQLYRVIGIVGTMDPLLEGLPFIGLEMMISASATRQWSVMLKVPEDAEILQLINTRIVHNFSLPQLITNLTILDPEKVLGNIELSIQQLEQLTHARVTNARKMSLYLHISCLIERLIRNAPISSYQNLEEFSQLHKKELEFIHLSTLNLETIYSIEIPLSEQAYIYDILYQET